ncbi:hypothetical protein EON63_18480 [archaeon]|nr:MAG: hypothetical protein EON63_18480 [archaeon]
MMFVLIVCMMITSRDFISPHTLRVESGLSHMMEQLETNSKARQIIGDISMDGNNTGVGGGKSSTNFKSEKMGSNKFFGILG